MREGLSLTLVQLSLTHQGDALMSVKLSNKLFQRLKTVLLHVSFQFRALRGLKTHFITCQVHESSGSGFGLMLFQQLLIGFIVFRALPGDIKDSRTLRLYFIFFARQYLPAMCAALPLFIIRYRAVVFTAALMVRVASSSCVAHL